VKEFKINYPDYEKPDATCVYKITIGNMFYYGSAVNFIRRVNTHISTMNTNRCLNKKMKLAINKFGTAVFDMVFVSDIDDVVAMEHFFITENINNPNSLNIKKSAYQTYRASASDTEKM